MAKFSPRNWFSFHWLRAWSWYERIIVAALAVPPFIALLVSGRDGGVTAACFALVWLAALNVIVHRHGGWGLLGPHFFYDVVRLARRGRSTALRVLYIFALFAGLAIVFQNNPVQAGWTPNEYAQVANRFTFTLFLIQNIAILVLAPAYLGSAIAEEKERRTLELLFTTHLSNTEIILGKLTSRVIHLVGFVLAGVPILCLIQFWGGIDDVVIWGNLANTLLNTLSIGSICLLFSTLARTVTGAVMTSYIVILPVSFCCMGFLKGFPFVLQDARQAGTGNVTVQDLGILCIVHIVIITGFLSLAIAALREHEPLGAALLPTPQRLSISHEPMSVGVHDVEPVPIPASTAITEKPTPKKHVPRYVERPVPARPVEPETEFSIPYTLPPVTDNALWWKERYVGGPPWFFSPVVLVPALPFLVTGFLVLGFWFVRSLFLSWEEFRRAVDAWAVVLRVLYYMCLAAYVLGVGFRAAASVARERQQQTLEALLLLPIDRSEVLYAKLYGVLVRGWPWLGLLALNLILGTLMGAYHPFTTIVLSTAPWAFVFFIAGLGLMLSVQMQTVLRANIVMLVVVMLLVAATFVLPWGWSPMTYLEPWVTSFWGRNGMDFEMHDALAGWQRRIGSMVVGGFYVVVAMVFFLAAFVKFGDRSRAASEAA